MFTEAREPKDGLDHDRFSVNGLARSAISPADELRTMAGSRQAGLIR
jgi:hypothetical protein